MARQPTEVFVTGSSGFLGTHLASLLLRESDCTVRLLSRRATVDRGDIRTVAVVGDLLKPHSFADSIAPGGDIVHLALLDDPIGDANISALRNLVAAGARAGARRFIHCSTAAVAGAASDRMVTETTPCVPRTDYERMKLSLERILIQEAGGKFQRVCVLRPTAIFGPAGRNLVALAEALARGSRLVNYLRSSLFRDRTMNLVPVENVAGAILHLLRRDDGPTVETFIVSDDEDPDNNFLSVERRLMESLGVPDYGIARVPLSPKALELALRLRGRSCVDPFRRYSSAKLRESGYAPPMPLSSALAQFAGWFRRLPARAPL